MAGYLSPEDAKSLGLEGASAQESDYLDPQQAAALGLDEKEPQSRTVGQRIMRGISNIPSDAAGVAKDVWTAVTSPVQTLKALDALAQGAGVAIGEKFPESMKRPGYAKSPEDAAKQEAFREVISPITKSIEDPAGIPGRVADYAEEHPVRAAINTSLSLGAASKAAKSAGMGRTGQALETAAKATSPLAPITATNKLIDKIPYVRAVKPSNWLPAIYQKAKRSPLAQEGEALEKATGVELTPAQKTGSRFLNYAEQTARDAAATADEIRNFDIKQANQAIDAVNRVMDKIGNGGKGAETVGDEVQHAVRNAIDTVKKTRRMQAEVDYGAVRAIAGNKPIIKLDTLKNTLKKIVAENDVPGGEPIMKQAKAMLAQVGGKFTVEKAMNIRRVYSEAARGTGNIFGDLDKAQSRRLAGQLTRAVEMDFELAPTTVEGVGSIREALAAANKNYKAYSQHIDAIENSVLGKMIGTDVVDPLSGMVVKGVAPEKVASKLLSLHPSELRVAKEILQGKSPEAWNSVRRHAIEQALEQSMDIPPSAGMNPVPISTSKFINKLPGQKNLDVLFSPDELKQISDIQKVMVRIGDRTGANTSKTAIVSEMMDWLTPKGATKAASRAIGLKTVSRAMTSPEGRAAMMEMAKARRSGHGNLYNFLKESLIAEYGFGTIESNYEAIKNINGIKYGKKGEEWYAL